MCSRPHNIQGNHRAPPILYSYSTPSKVIINTLERALLPPLRAIQQSNIEPLPPLSLLVSLFVFFSFDSSLVGVGAGIVAASAIHCGGSGSIGGGHAGGIGARSVPTSAHASAGWTPSTPPPPPPFIRPRRCFIVEFNVVRSARRASSDRSLVR